MKNEDHKVVVRRRGRPQTSDARDMTKQRWREASRRYYTKNREKILEKSRIKNSKRKKEVDE